MDTCKKYQKLIKQLVGSPINADQMTELNEHCKTCGDCRSLLAVHEHLSKSTDPVLLPENSEFNRMRQNVLRQIRLRSTVKGESLGEKILDLFKKPAFSYSFATLCLFAGLFFGKFTSPQNSTSSASLVEQIEYVAANNQDLRQVENSPYSYSNLEMEPLDNDRLHLSFNVSTHIELIRPKTDPLVRDILAQCLINPEQTGYRIRNMGYAEKIMDPKIKEALIFSLQNDPAMPVRLKALLNLMQYQNDDDIQSALLNVVRDEESVQMRLLAIDYLTEHKIDAAVLNRAAESSAVDFKAPVLVRTRQYEGVRNHF